MRSDVHCLEMDFRRRIGLLCGPDLGECRVTQEELIQKMQKRIARVSVTGPTVRTSAPKGSTKRIQTYLETVDLSLFSNLNVAQFAIALDAQTDNLRRVGEDGLLFWGPARKFINLFLRDATYNFVLRTNYQLRGIEPLLELPLDSHVAAGLGAEPEGVLLPEFTKIIEVLPEFHSAYQGVAAQVATREGIDRIHLDLKYWNPAAV